MALIWAGMSITLSGRGFSGQPKRVSWTLVAPGGVGPQIPTLPVLILARRMVNNELPSIGAFPCLGLFALEDFDGLCKPLGIYHYSETIDG